MTAKTSATAAPEVPIAEVAAALSTIKPKVAKKTPVAAPAPRAEAAGILKRSSSYYADPKTITRRAGFNPRFDFGEDLAPSIEAQGLLMPLRVKRIPVGDERLAQGFVFELIDGDRRLHGIESLLQKGHKFPEGVPVIIVEKNQSVVDDLIQMFVANQGKPFLPLEEAAAYQRMRDEGLTVKDICKAVGRAQMHVTSILALASADESFKQLVKEGKISKTMAKDIATNARGDKAKQRELAQEAAAAGGDKTKRRLISRKVQEARQAKAARKGKRVPKMRALSNEELSALGESVAARLPKLQLDAKAMIHGNNLEKWISQDDKLVLAFTFGALQALKAAAGVKAKLEL